MEQWSKYVAIKLDTFEFFDFEWDENDLFFIIKDEKKYLSDPKNYKIIQIVEPNIEL